MPKFNANGLLRSFAAEMKKPWTAESLWYETVANHPPTFQYARRIVPLYDPNKVKSRGKRLRKSMYQPQEIQWPEDKLRKRFYRDHPWELARPQIIAENDGNDQQYCDWSHMDQPRKALSGESVVQRTLWLIENSNMPVENAYDQARKEFYHLRAEQEIQQRVAHDQAQALGAVFTKSDLELGYEMDQNALNSWFDNASQYAEANRTKFTDPTVDISKTTQ
ncbi:37S ribosomal protein S25, mitochondrial [Schizosaccharomyces pombe]